MNLEKMIDDIYEKMQILPLSHIIPLILPIALELLDYEGYCLLTYWETPINLEANSKAILHKKIYNILFNEGLTEEKIDELIEMSFCEFMQLRTISSSQVLSLSAKEMEDKIRSLNDVMDTIEPPQGLHPVDLYFKNESTTKSKLSAIEKRDQIEKQYATLQSCLIGKLTEYRRKATNLMRKKELEKSITNSKNIFIIHGHNEAKRRELEILLKDKFNLAPIVLAEQPDQGLTIIEKFEKYANSCSYAFAIFTPDDIVSNGGKQYFQARPNVIFELGWFYANLGRSRVCILDQDSEKSEIFSDLQGVLRMQFNNNISEKYVEIERELQSLGII